MISSSPIRTKANRLNKILPINESVGEISQHDLRSKYSTKYIRCDDCLENIINDYEALVFYIANGFKPHWLPKEMFFEPESILVMLYANYVNLFEEFIQSIRDDTNLLKRTINLIDRNTFSFNYNFSSEVNSDIDSAKLNMDWLFKLSIVNGE